MPQIYYSNQVESETQKRIYCLAKLVFYGKDLQNIVHCGKFGHGNRFKITRALEFLFDKVKKPAAKIREIADYGKCQNELLDSLKLEGKNSYLLLPTEKLIALTTKTVPGLNITKVGVAKAFRNQDEDIRAMTFLLEALDINFFPPQGRSKFMDATKGYHGAKRFFRDMSAIDLKTHLHSQIASLGESPLLDGPKVACICKLAQDELVKLNAAVLNKLTATDLRKAAAVFAKYMDLSLLKLLEALDAQKADFEFLQAPAIIDSLTNFLSMGSRGQDKCSAKGDIMTQLVSFPPFLALEA